MNDADTTGAQGILRGIITFYSSQHAMHAEKVLKRHGFSVELIPGPKEISPNCGVAIRYDYEVTAAVQEVLAAGNVTYEACHRYSIPGKKSLLAKLLGR